MASGRLRSILTVGILGVALGAPSAQAAPPGRAKMKKVVRPYLPWLNATGKCESGNDPTADTGNGFKGEHQWLVSTWNTMGGFPKNHPERATRLRQRYTAVKLVRKRGPGPWPVCGVRAAGLLP